MEMPFTYYEWATIAQFFLSMSIGGKSMVTPVGKVEKAGDRKPEPDWSLTHKANHKP